MISWHLNSIDWFISWHCTVRSFIWCWNDSWIISLQCIYDAKQHSHGWTLCIKIAWWRHQMETFSALLDIVRGIHQWCGEFTAQRPVTRSFGVLFDLRLNKPLSKQSWGWWFEAPKLPLWRHCNGFGVCVCSLYHELWTHLYNSYTSSLLFGYSISFEITDVYVNIFDVIKYADMAT